MRTTRLEAAVHELRCAECRVTWTSWLLRVLHLGGMRPMARRRWLVTWMHEGHEHRRLFRWRRDAELWALKGDVAGVPCVVTDRRATDG